MKSASRRTAAQERTGGTSDPKRKQTGPSAKPGGAVYGVPGMPTTQAVLGRAHGQVMATKWRDRAVSPEHAVRGIRRGDRVFVGSACATPRTLLPALEAEASPPAGVHLVLSLTDGAVLDLDGRARSSFRHCAFYLGPRHAEAKPLRRRRLRSDVALGGPTPPGASPAHLRRRARPGEPMLGRDAAPAAVTRRSRARSRRSRSRAHC